MVPHCFSYLLLSTAFLSLASPVIASSNNNNQKDEQFDIVSSSAVKPVSAAKVSSYLKDFGLGEERISELLHQSSSWIDDSKMAQSSARLKANALWQIDQRITHPGNNQSSKDNYTLTPQDIAACMLYRNFSIRSKPLQESALQQIISLASHNPYLKQLEFFKCSLDDQAVKQLSALSHITHLSLEENNITDEGIPALVSHPSIVSLKLWKNKIGPKGAALFVQNPKLEELGLYKNNLGDEGVIALSAHPTLKTLDLRENGIGNDGAKALARNTVLKSLRLRYNKITDEGAQAFLSNHHITNLEIARNSVSEDLVFTLEHLAPSNAYLQFLKEMDAEVLPVASLPSKKHVRILSVDGGGIRGLLPAIILDHIGKQISEKLGAPFHWAKNLDLMSGTSTGALICLGLAAPDDRHNPQYLPQTLVDLYKKEGANIFPKPWNLLKKAYHAQYDPFPLEKILDGYFKDKFFSSSLSRLLITSYDLNSQQVYIFDSHQAKKEGHYDFQMRGVARATSAAPTYFPAAHIKNNTGTDYTFVDGGIYANNPTLLALKKAKQLYPNAEEYTIISLGTGSFYKRSLKKLKEAGFIQWGLQIPGVIIDNAVDYTEKLMDVEVREDSRVNYIRIQPSLGESCSELDDVRAENIEFLEKAATQALQDHKVTIDHLVQRFIKNYGLR